MYNKKKGKILYKVNKYFKKYKYLYFISIYKFNSDLFYKFKKDCFYNNIKLMNVKNTLLKKVLKKRKKTNICKILINNTFIMYSNNINICPIIIKKHKISIDNKTYPILKAAYLNDYTYFGEKHLKSLCLIKSKEETLFNILLYLKNIFSNLIIYYKNYYNSKFLNIIKALKKKSIKNEKNK
ncbi:MAG: 50S ribosomal protein L10 [Candidatus Shikimatogenerans bostrichidophilus]|nr:MAG: 50S ribosomal protein L10 [Candidatus Shikimatogenerans bostrichidophilus]